MSDILTDIRGDVHNAFNEPLIADLGWMVRDTAEGKEGVGAFQAKRKPFWNR